MCLMERYDSKLDMGLEEVRQAFERGALKVEVPGLEVDQNAVYMGQFGRYEGPALILRGSSIAQVTVVCTIDFDDHDDSGNPRFEVEVPEEPRLRYLVFDQQHGTWFLSCGGLDHCWWCVSEIEFDREMRDLGLGRSYAGSLDDELGDWDF